MPEEEEEEEKILGVWTKEEFMDDIVFGLFTMVIGFVMGFVSKFVSRWLKQHKWFKKEEE